MGDNTKDRKNHPKNIILEEEGKKQRRLIMHAEKRENPNAKENSQVNASSKAFYYLLSQSKLNLSPLNYWRIPSSKVKKRIFWIWFE